MRRHQVIALASVLAVIGGLLPIGVAFYVSWCVAVHAEEMEVEQLAQRVVRRANLAFASATTALRTMTDSRDAPCSAAHIAAMRRLVVDNPSIDEVGYFRDGLLRCTSWGEATGRIERTPHDYVTDEGIGVKASMWPRLTGSQPRMALHYGDYNVLVDPHLLVDVIVAPRVQLAVATERGRLIGTQNHPDQALLESLLAHPRTGMDERHVFAAVRSPHWTAVAMLSRDGVRATLEQQRTFVLPVGIALGGLIVGLVIWLTRRRLSPLGELSAAVRMRQFVVRYQPVIELATGVCVGAEALVRWRLPNGSFAQPNDFIPLAEQSGLIAPITDQIAQIIVDELSAALVAHRSLHIGINLSASDIMTGRAVAFIRTLLEPAGIQPQQIWLEATERGFIDIERARKALLAARMLGHTIAIDDLGTGYSSLCHLQSLPLHALKIDKTFIDTIGHGGATSSVTPHIIDMARTLKLFAIAEGVETEEQFEYLRDRGVHFGQGWFFSEALPAEDFVRFFRLHAGATRVACFKEA